MMEAQIELEAAPAETRRNLDDAAKQRLNRRP